MQRPRLGELLRVRQLRADLAKSQAARAFREYAEAEAAVNAIKRSIAELEQQALLWDIPQTTRSGDALVDAGYMHNVMSCRDQARIRAREAAASLPRAELARQRAHSEAREARMNWSRAARRAEVIARYLKQTQQLEYRKKLDREEEQLAEERSASTRLADIGGESYS
jgi:hypothetical protein